MLFSQISEKSAAYISQEINLDKDREEILAYAIETMLLSFVGFILIILLGFLFNAALPAAIAAISGGLLRRLSGGAHFNTPYKCLVFGAIVYGLLGLAVKAVIATIGFSLSLNIPLLIGTLLLVGIFAPVDSEAKPIHSSDLRKKLKASSIIFVLVIFFLAFFLENPIIVQALVLGIVYQAITLLPIFNQ
ncbi:MAG: accessory gene regulator B family protein [Clostridia bacterium]|nr:accessory gene regulator B family protein [Clostridia bacterium]